MELGFSFWAAPARLPLRGARSVPRGFRSQDGPNRTGTTRALDCGAGIGRITKRLLLPLFKTVDMVDVTEDFLTKARSYLGEEGRRVRNYFCCGLQDFSPEPNSYDVIWIQWVIGEGLPVACPLPVQPHGHQGGLGRGWEWELPRGGCRIVGFFPQTLKARARLSPWDTSWTPPKLSLENFSNILTAWIRRDPNSLPFSSPHPSRCPGGSLTPANPCSAPPGHLTDNHLSDFLKRCRAGLRPNGIVVIKDNMAQEGVIMDDVDSSVCRDLDVVRKIIRRAGLHLLAEERQENFPDEIYHVYTFAMR